MLNLSNLIHDGVKFQVHLQVPNDLRHIEQQFRDTEKLSAFLHEGASAEIGDLATGQTVHCMFHESGFVSYKSEGQFAEWNNEWDEPEPDFARIERALEALLGAISQNHAQFKGATDEQAEKYSKIPVALTIMLEDLDCRLCVVPTGECPIRKADFDEEALKTEISRRQASIN